MPSNDALANWLAKNAGLVQRRELGPEDASAKLDLARRNLRRARRNVAADPDLALVSAETGMVNATDAVLAPDGYRLRGKTGSHRARFEYPNLPAEFRAARADLARFRALRSTAMYDVAGAVDREDARAALATAERLIRAARRAL